MVQRREGLCKGAIRRWLALSAIVTSIPILVLATEGSRVRGRSRKSQSQTPLASRLLWEDGVHEDTPHVRYAEQNVFSLSDPPPKETAVKKGCKETKEPKATKAPSEKKIMGTKGMTKAPTSKGMTKAPTSKGMAKAPVECTDDPAAGGVAPKDPSKGGKGKSTKSPTSPPAGGVSEPGKGKGKGGAGPANPNPASPTPGDGTNPGSPTPSPGDGSNPGGPMPSPGDGSNPGAPQPSPGDGSNPGVPMPSPGDGSTPSGPEPSPGDGSNPGVPAPSPGDGGGPMPPPGDGNNPVVPGPSDPSGGPASPSPGDGSSPSPPDSNGPSDPSSGPAEEPQTGTGSSVDCDAIAAGNGDTDGDSVVFEVGMDLTIFRGVAFSAVAEQLQMALQRYAAPRTSEECLDTRIRVLQESDTLIRNTVFGEVTRDTQETCESPAGVSEADCFPTKTEAEIFYTGTDTDDFGEILTGAISDARNEGLLNVAGLADLSGVEAAVDSDGGGSAGVQAAQGSDGDDDGLGPVGIALISCGAVAAVLVAALLIKRNRSSSELSHVYLDDDDDRIAKEIGGDSDTEASSAGRKAVVLGEEDSIASAWTGPRPPPDEAFTIAGYDGPDAAILGKSISTHDVHTCNSSMCEICERQRKTDPTFISTGSPSPPPRLPANAVREYLAEDTVDL